MLVADLLVIYTGLPACVYKPLRHMVYHPRLIDLVFPHSHILRGLAEEHCLVTTVSDATLNVMQKNAIAEWLLKPVYSSHPVFHGANKLFDRYFPIWMRGEADFWSESDTRLFHSSSVPLNTAAESDTHQAAVEEHPLADKKKKKKSKRKMLRLKDRLLNKPRYGQLDEEQPSTLSSEQVELSMYGAEGGFSLDSMNQVYL